MKAQQVNENFFKAFDLAMRSSSKYDPVIHKALIDMHECFESMEALLNGLVRSLTPIQVNRFPLYGGDCKTSECIVGKPCLPGMNIDAYLRCAMNILRENTTEYPFCVALVNELTDKAIVRLYSFQSPAEMQDFKSSVLKLKQ